MLVTRGLGRKQTDPALLAAWGLGHGHPDTSSTTGYLSAVEVGSDTFYAFTPGSMPVLSNPTVVDVWGRVARPRVTVTY